MYGKSEGLKVWRFADLKVYSSESMEVWRLAGLKVWGFIGMEVCWINRSDGLKVCSYGILWV